MIILSFYFFQTHIQIQPESQQKNNHARNEQLFFQEQLFQRKADWLLQISQPTPDTG